MPIFLEPNQEFPIVLGCDKDKPEQTRPTFFARSQSMRQQQELGKKIDALTEGEKSLEQLFSDTVDEVMQVVTGWKNMGGHEFSRESVMQVLSYGEARELLRKVMANQHVGPEEKKDSE